MQDSREPESRLAFSNRTRELNSVNLNLFDAVERQFSSSMMQSYLSDTSDKLMWKLSRGGGASRLTTPAVLAQVRESAEEVDPIRKTPVVIEESRLLLQLLRQADAAPQPESSRTEIRELILRLSQRTSWRLVTRPSMGDGAQQPQSGEISRLFAFGASNGTQQGHEGPNAAPEAGEAGPSGPAIDSTPSTTTKSNDFELRCCYYFRTAGPGAGCRTISKYPCRLV